MSQPPLDLFSEAPDDEPRGRKRPDGVSTTNVVLSASIGDNAPAFRDILKLFVPDGSTVADVTWGKGNFWTHIPQGKYKVLATDIQMGVDCRALPYEDASIDALVLDPPYMEGLFRRKTDHMAGNGSHSAFRKHYSDGKAFEQEAGAPRYHDAVLDLYLRAGQEAKRVLRNYGVFIVKCQDEVSANTQRLTHVELINAWAQDFYCKDLFVVVRANKPGIVRLLKQEHARKNHSYFLVLVKRDPKHPKRIRPPKRAEGRKEALLHSVATCIGYTRSDFGISTSSSPSTSTISTSGCGSPCFRSSTNSSRMLQGSIR